MALRVEVNMVSDCGLGICVIEGWLVWSVNDDLNKHVFEENVAFLILGVGSTKFLRNFVWTSSLKCLYG